VSLDKENFDKATALEIAAGGRLFNVVVQDEQVGKELIMNGKLRKRVTIIPLNKIEAFKASVQVQSFLARHRASLIVLP
jgi:structural maintenance of chromosome 2